MLVSCEEDRLGTSALLGLEYEPQMEAQNLRSNASRFSRHRSFPSPILLSDGVCYDEALFGNGLSGL